MKHLLRVVLVSFLLLVAAGVALGSSGYFARLFVDGVEVASQQLDPGTRDVRVVVDGPAGTLLDESFQVEVPEDAPTHLVIDSDTLIENETLTLRAGDSIEFRNGARLMFGEGASADWQGTPTSTWSDDGAVQNLDRDIDIFGSGDIMFMAGSRPSVIRFVEIDLQPVVELDHYPLHWHFVGDGSRGTLVEGVVVKNSTNRAFVPHASHGITFRDTIASNIIGDAYWWNRPAWSRGTEDSSHDILYDHALADNVHPREGNRGLRLGAFNLGQGFGNTIRDSVALNTVGDVKGSGGFVWPELSETVGTVWTFENNKSFGSSHWSAFVWQNGGEHLVDDFVGDKPLFHGAYGNSYHYRNIDVPGVDVWATGWQITGGSIGDVVDREHKSAGSVTFTDIDIDSLTFDNPSDKPAHYVITNAEGSTFGCGDVAWVTYPAGSSVTVDGETCQEGNNMAFPSVRSAAASTTATATGMAPTMPASISSGDLLLAVIGNNSSGGNPDFTSFPNWTEQTQIGFELWVYARVATGDANDTISANFSTTRGLAWTVMSIQDWEGTLTGVELATASSLDPPSLTPSWGSADTLWVEGIVVQGGTIPTVTAWSTNYTEIDQVTGDFSTDVLSGAAYRQLAASTEDPGNIVVSSQTAVRTVTIGVEPSAGGPSEGTGSASIAVTTSAEGERTAKGTASADIAITTTAAGARTAKGAGSADITVSTTGAGQSSATPTGTGAANLTVDATATGHRIAKGEGSATVTVSTAAEATKTAMGEGSANIVVTVTATGFNPASVAGLKRTTVPGAYNPASVPGSI